MCSSKDLPAVLKGSGTVIELGIEAVPPMFDAASRNPMYWSPRLFITPSGPIRAFTYDAHVELERKGCLVNNTYISDNWLLHSTEPGISFNVRGCIQPCLGFIHESNSLVISTLDFISPLAIIRVYQLPCRLQYALTYKFMTSKFSHPNVELENVMHLFHIPNELCRVYTVPI